MLKIWLSEAFLTWLHYIVQKAPFFRLILRQSNNFFDPYLLLSVIKNSDITLRETDLFWQFVANITFLILETEIIGVWRIFNL